MATPKAFVNCQVAVGRSVVAVTVEEERFTRSREAYTLFRSRMDEMFMAPNRLKT